jgi:sarcosine oxidase, subunit beta
VRRDRRLFIAAGYSGHGFLMGPATGEIVRDLVLEREPAFDVTPFRLNRFRTADDAPSEVNIV